MTRHEIELLVKMRSEADAALNRTSEGLRATTKEAFATAAAFDRVAASTKAAVPLVDQIDKIVDRFTKDTGEATRAAMAYSIAVEQLGGASKLTATQHAEVTKAVDRANGAYKAMGTDAPAHLRVLQRDLDGTATKATGLGTVMGSVKGIAAGMFVGFSAVGIAQGLKTLAVDAVSLAGTMTDLANQSGVTASSLLKMANAAELSGVDVTSLSTILTKMTDTIAGGDTAAAGAVKALGLNLGELQRLSPDEMFLALVTSLSKVSDANLQTKLTFDVFGRGAKDALKLVRDGFVENQAGAATWSAEQLAILEQLGDRWTKFKQQSTSAIGAVMAAMATAQQWKDTQTSDFFTWGDMLNPFTADRGTGLPSGPNTRPSAPGAMAGTNQFTTVGLEAAEAYTKIMEDTAKEARKAAEESRKLREEQEAGWRAAEQHTARLYAESKALADMSRMAFYAAQGLDSVNRSRASYSLLTLQSGIPGVVDGLPSSLTGYRNQVSTPGINAPVPKPPGGLNWTGQGGILSQLPGQIVSVFSGGGGSKQIGGGLGSIGGSIGGAALATGMGFAAGSVMGSVLPVVGTLIGGFLGRQLGGLMGPSRNAVADREATGRIGTSQAGLIDKYGSVEQIAGMTQAGAELAAGWGHQGRGGEAAFKAQLKAFEESLKRQNDLLGQQETLEGKLADKEAARAALIESLVPKWNDVSGALERYGISLDGAGGKVQQLGATATFKSMLEDIQLLERAGVDVGGMLAGMADEISGVVQESLRLGTEIPANMRPYVEELARSGQLVDANGKSITDLSNLKWGEKVETEADKTTKSIDGMTEAIDGFKKALDEIIKALKDLLPAAAAEGARGTQEAWDRNRPTFGYDVEGNRGTGEPTNTYDVPGAANGVIAGGARGAKFRIFGEREPELGGSVDFMSRVLAKAMSATGQATGGAGMRIEVVSVIDGKVAARSLSGPLVRDLHARGLLK